MFLILLTLIGFAHGAEPKPVVICTEKPPYPRVATDPLERYESGTLTLRKAMAFLPSRGTVWDGETFFWKGRMFPGDTPGTWDAVCAVLLKTPPREQVILPAGEKLSIVAAGVKTKISKQVYLFIDHPLVASIRCDKLADEPTFGGFVEAFGEFLSEIR